VNGTIQIKNPLRAPFISANFKANDVKFGTDTLGDVNIIGDYDHMRRLVSIDPQTGVYFKGSSLTASGKVSFDSNINQQLSGMVKFSDVPVSWASPFVSGIFSRMSGKLNGSVAIGGKSYSPDIEGDVKVQNCGFKLDYMGVSYTIPKASVHIDNTHISFDSVKAYDAGKNSAYITGCFYHNLFRDMRMHINVRSPKIEVMHLSKTENTYFYGTVTAGMDSFVVSGPFSNIFLNAYNVYPAAKSRIFLPMQTTGDAGAYNYVTFKSYGKLPEKPVKQSSFKLNIGIDANLNDLADISILLDPSSDDAIDAKGDGNIQINMPADNDMRIAGNFNIESGTYSFTFKQLKNFKKQFKLNSGSTIYFKGPFGETTVDVFATYTAKARLMDLLSTTEQAALTSSSDIIDAKRIQPIDIVLHMQDNLFNPKLTFDMSVEDKRMENNPAFAKLVQVNQDDRQKFDQVASLLLTGNFLSQEGLFGTGSVTTGAINNFSQILSSTASSTLTGVVNKLVGENKVNINVNYQNYSIADAGITTQNRNQFTGTISQNYLNDRLTVEIGGKSDFAHPAGNGAVGSLNITGDFKIQYLVSPASHLRLNCFSTNDFDATLEKSITRNGVGLSWRKSFDNVHEFFNSKKSTSTQAAGTPTKDSTKKNAAGKSAEAF
jgi:TamB, inner membrane protein subunit of TAM complex